MLPQTINCDDCGRKAKVRAYGRIEYDWPKTTNDGQVATMPLIRSIRLTIDCPNCGVKQQDCHPDNSLWSFPNRPSAPAPSHFRRAK